MIFLIEYDRSRGNLVAITRFLEAERLQAEQSRLTLEIDLNRKEIDHEVVLLQAQDEKALRRTHRRYFEDLEELVAR
jgi:hypothetical protein